MSRRRTFRLVTAIAPSAWLLPALLLGVGASQAAPLQEQSSLLADGRIGYVVFNRHWSLYQTGDGKAECPNGFNDGPREEFKKLYDSSARKLSVVDTQLQWEGNQWHPSTSKYRLPFHEVRSRISHGLNLDGKTGPEDFVSPAGEPGIDNQMYRALGCVDSYRTDGSLYTFENTFLVAYADARLLIELSDVDDLDNDDAVTVTTYRGMDNLLGGATGKDYLPGGTQHVEMRWSKEYVQRLKGKIVDGVLTTEPIDSIKIPWGMTANVSPFQVFRGMRLKLKLTPRDAQGIMAGYVDIDAWHHAHNINLSTHHQSYGRASSPSIVAALNRLADGYPDESGRNTAISAAVDLKMIQVYVVHPVSSDELVTSAR